MTGEGKRAVSASVDQTLKVWDLESGRKLRTLEGHSGVVAAVAVTGDGKRAVSASLDKTLKVWDLESGRILATFTCDGAANCCAFAGNHTVIAGDFSGKLHFLRFEESAAETYRPPDESAARWILTSAFGEFRTVRRLYPLS